MTNPVLLRPVLPTDLPILFEHQSDSESAYMAGVPSRDHDTFMAHWAKILNNPDSLIRAIVWEGEVTGTVLSFERDGHHEIGYWLGKTYWGKGIATQALAAFLPLLPMRPLHAFTVKHNLGSQRVLQKCGFKRLSEEEEGFVFILEG